MERGSYVSLASLYFFSLKWTHFGYLEVYKQIKALQPPSVLFQFQTIIIKSGNKQSLIKSHSLDTDESFYVTLNSLK